MLSPLGTLQRARLLRLVDGAISLAAWKLLLDIVLGHANQVRADEAASRCHTHPLCPRREGTNMDCCTSVDLLVVGAERP